MHTHNQRDELSCYNSSQPSSIAAIEIVLKVSKETAVTKIKPYIPHTSLYNTT